MADEVYRVPLDQLAKLLDCTPRRCQQLAADGIIPKPVKGRYEVVASVVGYIRFLRSRAQGVEVGGEHFQEQRARLTKTRAEIAEMERARLAGELIPVGEIEQAWLAMVGALKSRLLSIATKLAPRLITLRNVREVKTMLANEVHEALDELSKLYVESAGPNGGAGAPRVGGAGAAAGPDGL